MKHSLVGIMAGLAMATATQANAAEPPVLDKEAGTILSNISADKNDTPIKELLSCKYAYITVTRGQSVHTIDLLAGLQGPVVNKAVENRVAAARTECTGHGLKPAF